MGFIKEFKEFALKGNVMDMAVGVIIGGAFTSIVTSLTGSILQPILYVATGAMDFETWTQSVPASLSVLGTAVVNFLITALVLFLIIKAVRKAEAKAAEIAASIKGTEEAAPAAPTTKVCPFCKSEIHIDATRCPHCTAEIK